jgi:hypothetical protein
MKSIRQLLTVTLALLWSAALASALPGRAEVKKVFGTATVTKAAGGSARITVGMVLGTGDTITTDRASCVHLWLGINGEAMQVAPDTTLKLDNLEIVSVSGNVVNTQVSLTKGAVNGVILKKLASASKYEIKTASGVAGIRGTIFGYTSSGALMVLHGTVNFNYTVNGQVKVMQVQAGQQFTPGDAKPTPANFLNGAAAAAFTDVLTSSGLVVGAGDGAIIKALASALDIPATSLIQYLSSAGAAVGLSGVTDSGSDNPLTVSAN